MVQEYNLVVWLAQEGTDALRVGVDVGDIMTDELSTEVCVSIVVVVEDKDSHGHILSNSGPEGNRTLVNAMPWRHSPAELRAQEPSFDGGVLRNRSVGSSDSGIKLSLNNGQLLRRISGNLQCFCEVSLVLSIGGIDNSGSIQ